MNCKQKALLQSIEPSHKNSRKLHFHFMFTAVLWDKFQVYIYIFFSICYPDPFLNHFPIFLWWIYFHALPFLIFKLKTIQQELKYLQKIDSQNKTDHLCGRSNTKNWIHASGAVVSCCFQFIPARFNLHFIMRSVCKNWTCSPQCHAHSFGTQETHFLEK